MNILPYAGCKDKHIFKLHKPLSNLFIYIFESPFNHLMARFLQIQKKTETFKKKTKTGPLAPSAVEILFLVFKKKIGTKSGNTSQ